TGLDPCRRPIAPNSTSDRIETLRTIEGFEQVEKPDGTTSLRIHGLEFASRPGRESLSELTSHAATLSAMRRTPGSLLYRKEAERWLESKVRANIQVID